MPPNIFDCLGEVIFDQKEINSRIKELAAIIEDRYMPEAICMVPVLGGAYHFASKLALKIRLPVLMTPIHVSSYDGDEQLRDLDVIIPKPDLMPKRILLVEDIVDSGRTLATLHQALLETCKVEEIVTATLLHKGKVSNADVPVEFVGFQCPNKFVVGMGMDYRGYFRNLPAIHRLAEKF